MKTTPSILCSLWVALSALCMAHTAAAQTVAAPELVTLNGIIHPDSDDTLPFTDGQSVYYTGQSGIWQLSLTRWLKQQRHQQRAVGAVE